MISKKDKIMMSLNKEIKFLERRYNPNEFGKILGINYLLATIYTIEEMDGKGIFKDESDFSSKFLVKRLRRLNNLLSSFKKSFNDLETNILNIENDLNEKIFKFKYNEKTDWLNKNGYYSFYNEIKENCFSYNKLGLEVKERIKSINSK